MRKLATALLFVIAAAALARADEDFRALEDRLQAVAREAEPKTVLVYGLFGLGTGARIDAEGRVVTNAHVAAGARFAVIVTPDGRRVLAHREGIDYERDLAVLRPLEKPALPAPHFALREGDAATGEWVCALGYPGGPRGDARPTFTIGRVQAGFNGGNVRASGIVPLDYTGALRSDTPIFFGNSGGPLVDLEGRLVGINGALAVDGDGFHGLTIRSGLVRERIASLKGGLVRLPGGTVLDPKESRLAKRLEDLLDPLVKGLMEARLEGEKATPEELRRKIESTARTLAQAAPDQVTAGVDRFIEHVRRGPRHQAFQALESRLGARLSAVRPLEIEVGEGARPALGTLVPGLGIVACASRVPADLRAARTRDGLALRAVARSEAYDLVLFRPESEGVTLGGASVVETAPPVGSLVLALGAKGPRSSGVLSAAPRPVPFEGAQALAAPSRSIGRRIVEGVLKLSEALGVKDVQDLARSIIKSMEFNDSMRAGSPPRAYPWVVSIDAPLGPGDAGATLVDAEGRLLGVVAANAHFGTSYAVPIATVREVFAGK